jgi:hypothetical protein
VTGHRLALAAAGPGLGALALAALALATLGLAGCSSSGSTSGGATAAPSSAPATSAPASASASSGSASSSGSFGLRYGDAPALLTQCGLTSGTIKPPSGQPWLSGKTVLVQAGPGSGSHAAELATWWNANMNMVVGGQPLSYWQQWAAQHDALPTQVCGTSVSASALQAKLSPGQPNPWGS